MNNIYDRAYEQGLEKPLIYTGHVVDNKDIKGTGRITVRIPNIDSNVVDAQLTPAFPLLPLSINQIPKIGQTVKIMFASHFNANEKSLQSTRYYIESNSAYPNIGDDPYFFLGKAAQKNGFIDLEDLNLKTSEGLYPNEGETTLLGKTNTDVILKPQSATIRAGKHKLNQEQVFNNIDPAYIQLKFGFPEDTIQEIVEVDNYNYKNNVAEQQFNINRLSETSYSIDVYDIRADRLVFRNTVSQNTPQRAIAEVKNIIRDLKKRYPSYKLFHEIDELNNIPQESSFDDLKKETITRVSSPKTESGSVINIAADRINLLSHLSLKEFNTAKQSGYIDDQTKVNTDTYSMVHGEKLVEFLKLLVEFVTTHTHVYSNMPPSQCDNETKITSYQLNTMLSDYIKLL